MFNGRDPGQAMSRVTASLRHAVGAKCPAHDAPASLMIPQAARNVVGADLAAVRGMESVYRTAVMLTREEPRPAP